MERFILLHGLAYAYRQALLHPSDCLAADWDGSPGTQREAEKNYDAVRALYDEQVKFQARYLFSAPVDEDKPEVYGMAAAVLRWRGIHHPRADLESQLERLQELATRFLAEREASRRQSEARRSTLRHWLLYGTTLSVLGVVIAGGEFALSLQGEIERLPLIGG